MSDPLAPHTIAVFRAFADRIVPADEFPSAGDAGAWGYVRRLLATESPDVLSAVNAGLDRLDALARGVDGRVFVEVDSAAQDAAITALGESAAPADRAAFFWLVEAVLESYYADPANGGNARAASWKMIGYDPGVPGYDGSTYFRETT